MDLGDFCDKPLLPVVPKMETTLSCDGGVEYIPSSMLFTTTADLSSLATSLNASYPISAPQDDLKTTMASSAAVSVSSTDATLKRKTGDKHPSTILGSLYTIQKKKSKRIAVHQNEGGENCMVIRGEVKPFTN